MDKYKNHNRYEMGNKIKSYFKSNDKKLLITYFSLLITLYQSYKF